MPKRRGNPNWMKGKSANPDTQWKPGQSGNPVGLPEEYRHVRELAKEYTGNAVRALVEIANDERHRDRAWAADRLLDRAWGQTNQKVEVTGKDGGPLVVEVRKFSDEPSTEGGE
jgi:hypothetical protein